MSNETYAKAWCATAVKQGVALGVLAGDAFAATLAAASLAIPADATLAEREVNERLRAWLAGPGAMLATDHVELRRWLVDLKLVERDGYGRAYKRAAPPPAFVDAVTAMAAIDAVAVADDARASHAKARAERRARHEAANVR
ncbi:MAG TPA: DUF2087 domain-containing protein [Casimicrobiaceae bacterium]|jgi:hypothetical protein